jgi:predicted O-linked N-acetylglucosamine transferase (SPINDLY family)
MGSLLTASILTGLGKREWIANSPTELVDKVEFLVSNQSQEARKSLRALYLNSMLCDAKNMAKEFMKAIDLMTKEWHKEKVSPGNISDTD